jgi:hypothetical protein
MQHSEATKNIQVLHLRSLALKILKNQSSMDIY